MSQSLGSIVVDLQANTAGFVSGMSKAQTNLKSTVKSMGESLKGFGDAASSVLSQVGGQMGAQLSEVFNGIGETISGVAAKIGAASGAMEIATVAAGGLAAAGIAVVGALSGIALSGGEMAESLSLMSQRTGISIRNLQTLQAAGDSVGVPLEDLSAGFRKFSEALAGSGKGSAAQQAVLKELGVTSGDTFTALSQLADAFSRMQDGPVKASLAAELFGKSSASWIPILDRGRDGLQEFSDIVDKFGPNIDQNAVKGMENWKRSTTELSQAWDSFKVSLSGGVDILAKLVDYTARATKGAADMAKTFVQHPFLSSLAASTGGVGLLAIHQFSQAGSDSVKTASDSAAQQAQIAAQDQLITKQKELFQIEQAGGKAQYALEKQKADIQGAAEANDFKHAAALQAEIPALEAAAEKEKERLAAAKAAVAAHERLLELIKKQSEGLIHITNTTRPYPVVAAPEMNTTAEQFESISESLQKLNNVGGVTDSILEMGKNAVSDFYTAWDKDSKNTVDQITQRYTDQLNHFEGLLALGAISQEDFNKVSVDLETQRIGEIQKLQEKQGSSFAVSFASMFADIADQSTALAKHMADDIGGALNDLSSQFARLAVTGKANFAQVGKSLEENLVKTGANALIGSATSHIAGAFGVKLGKPDGSKDNPIYTRSADSVAGKASSIAHGLNFGHIGSDISGAFKNNLGGSFGSLFGKIGSLFSGGSRGGFSSIFGSIGSLFAGFRSGGGPVSPDYSYMVGEHGAERFVPDRPGQIVPNQASGARGKNQPDIHVHFHGITDYNNGFRPNQNQVLNHLATAVSRAVARR